MRHRAVDRDRDEEQHRQQDPKTARGRRFARHKAGHLAPRDHRPAMLAFAVARLSDPQRHSREGDEQGQQPEHGIGAAPSDPFDQCLGQLRHDKAADPDP